MFRFSYFTGFYSKDPMVCELRTFDDFIKTMAAMSEIPGYKPSYGEYDKEFPLISPAFYKDGDTRLNENVIGWDMVMMDIDDGIDSVQTLRDHFRGFKYLIYSSPNCTAKHLKLRVCLPLDTFASSEHLCQLWFAVNAWCDGIIDKQTKDKSRMFYISAQYTNKGDDYMHIFEVGDGYPLNWQGIIDRYPSPREEDRFLKVNKLSALKRKIFLKNNMPPCMVITERDCPFVYQHMIDEYLLTPAGGHHLALYRFMLKVCYNAEKINYPLSIDELVDMTQQLDGFDGGFYDDKKFFDSAKDAMEYVGI